MVLSDKMRAGALLVLVAVIGCDKGNPNWKETIPVTGQVLVAGQPATGVMIEFHAEAGIDATQPTVTNAVTLRDGKFAATTYVSDDGAPAGDYKLTFTWPDKDVVFAEDGAAMIVGDGTDQLEGRYSALEKSEHSISVVSGEPVDMGTIELR